MKIAALMGVVCALVAAPAMAVTISFADTLVGVDNPNSAPFTWSTDDNVAELNTSYSLLGGKASVSGTQDGTPDNLSARLTRGLGVWDIAPFPEEDEIDNFDGTERVTIAFNSHYIVNSIELRSLFADSNTDYLGRTTPVEQAMILFYNNGSLVQTSFVKGTGTLGVDDGDASISFGSGVTVDEVVFQVPTSADLGLSTVGITHDNDPYTFTDYAVAKLDVTLAPAPEPLTTSLGLMGLISLGLATRRGGIRN